jgi:hypothetical protein
MMDPFCQRPLTKPNSSLLAFPQFPNPLTESVVRELFTPTPDELRWVWHTSSVPEARLGLLCLLKSFPLLGRFPAPASIPASIAAFLAQHAGLGVSTPLEYPKRTRVRHQVEIRRYLGVHAWSPAAAALATETMQRTVTHEANKVEHYHDFASHLNFGSHGVLRTNSRVDQEKAMIANQLVANAVISQTVADQTRVIQQLKSEGYPFKLSDVKHLSPYLTRHLLRFGKFPVRCKTEPLPDNLGLNP